MSLTATGYPNINQAGVLYVPLGKSFVQKCPVKKVVRKRYMMVSKSERERIDAMPELRKTILVGNHSAALDISLRHDELNEPAETINVLLKKSTSSSSRPKKSTGNEDRYLIK
jgi:hypothetical protein